jgi:transcription termination factor Rho
MERPRKPQKPAAPRAPGSEPEARAAESGHSRAGSAPRSAPPPRVSGTTSANAPARADIATRAEMPRAELAPRVERERSDERQLPRGSESRHDRRDERPPRSDDTREGREPREDAAARDGRASSDRPMSTAPEAQRSRAPDAPGRERGRNDAPLPSRPNGDGAERENRQRDDWRKPDKRRGSARRGGRRRRRGRNRDGDPNAPKSNPTESSAPAAVALQRPPEASANDAQALRDGARSAASSLSPAVAEPSRQPAGPRGNAEPVDRRREPERRPAEKHEPRIPLEGEGMLVKEMGGFGVLRQLDNQYLPSRSDIFVPQRLIQLHRLRDGSIVRGRIGRGQKHKYALNDVSTIDGKSPNEVKSLPEFKTLTTIDPDFHYAVGDATGDVSMRILDIICPVGRGQRGLIVAPPRAGKTTILRQFAKGIEVGYPDVNLMVLLVDERPEEATEWKRCTKGQVFVSTADESAKTHIQLAETVWKHATRLVELGQDVVLLLDSITRLARAYNNQAGGSGRTMSGGLDSQAMQKPRQIFGSARNTESAGSLTILGTTLVETGSRMDQLIFEEFKGTGNMELVLSRKLADRRIFPAIDIEKSGTRKEEKLYSAKRMKYIAVLRRVLLRMNFIEAMELLVTKLDDVASNDEFLKRFEVDPEA